MSTSGSPSRGGASGAPVAGDAPGGTAAASSPSARPASAATTRAHRSIVGASNSVESGRSTPYFFRHLVEEPHGDERLAAELEEVVVDPDLLETEQLAPHPRERALDVVARSDELRAQRGPREALCLGVGRVGAGGRTGLLLDLRQPVAQVHRRRDDVSRTRAPP